MLSTFPSRQSRARRRRSRIFCAPPYPWSTPNQAPSHRSPSKGPFSFAIFDTFDDEAGRDPHLNGKVAAALMEKVKASDLLPKPEIHKLGILADKLPK